MRHRLLVAFSGFFFILHFGDSDAQEVAFPDKNLFIFDNSIPKMSAAVIRKRIKQESVPAQPEFLLDPSGVITAAGPSFRPADGYSYFSHILGADNKLAKVGPGNAKAWLHPKKSDQIGSLPQRSGSQPVCGASPFSPDEIAVMVAQTAQRYGVEQSFAKAIAWAESRFDQQRNSPKGARGPMQLIPETAARLRVADICDPVANIDGGMRYLRSLIDTFGNPLLAAAAYNAGEQRIYEHHGVPPYPETVRYVADVINYQLGLTEPRQPTTPKTSPQQQALKANTPDVIGATRTARFVSGVMQF